MITTPAPRTAESLSERERHLVFIALLASVTAAGFAIGGIMPLVSFLLERRGTPASLIGVNAALPVAAIILMSLLLGRLARTFGIKAVLFTGLFLTAGATLAMAYFTSLEAWMALRFLTGLGAGAHWILSETWINAVAPDHRRGLYSGIYSTMFSLGFVISPIVLTQIDIETALPFHLLIGLMLASALPLWLARNLLPDVTAESGAPAWHMLRTGPLIFAAALAAGISDASLWALLGVYALRNAIAEADTLVLLSVFAAGTVVLQPLIGWLADRDGLQRWLTFSAAAGAVGALLLPFAVGSPLFLWALLFPWGGLMVGLYTLGLAQMGRRFQGASLAGANALFISLYTVGSMTGPPVYGMAMDRYGPNALPIGVAVCCAALVIASLAAGRTSRV
ncbi:MAG: MFS transporter [Hyphomicrobiaceae bacterium]